MRDDPARFGLLPMHVQLPAYLARANRYSDMPIAPKYSIRPLLVGSINT